MKKFAYILLLVCVFPVWLQAQNLDKMSKNRRSKILVGIAKRIVMKHGPDYYRDYQPPIIEVDSITRENASKRHQPNIGRSFYRVKFLYDKERELLNMNEAAMVAIWADTGKAFSVLFGNGFGLHDLDKEDVDAKIPYQSVPKLEEFDWKSFNDSIFKAREMEERRDSIINLNR